MVEDIDARIAVRLTAIEEKLDAHAANVTAFWDRDWPILTKRLDDHERRLRVLEGIMSDIPSVRGDMRRLTAALQAETKRTTDLERFRTRIAAYWAATVAIAGFVATIAFWLLERVILPRL